MMQLANGAQGIPGRLCGYHQNRSFKLLASVPLLQKYSEFENNWELIMKEYMTTNISSNMMLFNYKGIIKQINFNSRKF